MRIAAFVFLVNLILVSLGGGASTPHEALLVLSKGDHTLAIVDPASRQVVAKAPVGEDPHEVIASSDGTRAYVSNYGGGRYRTLAVIDLVNQKPLSSIDLGALNGPHGLFFSDGKLWFTAEGAKAVARYDPQKKSIDWILGTGQNRTHMLYVTADRKHLFTTNIASGTVTIAEQSARDWDETVVPVGKGAEGFDVAPGERELWAANAGEGTVSVIDLASKKVVDTLQANVRGANRLKFTPDGKLVVISSLGNAGLTILDAHTRKEIKRFPLAHGAAGIQMQPDGSRAYVACTNDDYVTVLNLKTLKMDGRIEAGAKPDGMAWSILH